MFSIDCGGHEFCASLFSFANKNWFPLCAPNDTAQENRIWVLNTWNKFDTNYLKTEVINYCLTLPYGCRVLLAIL